MEVKQKRLVAYRISTALVFGAGITALFVLLLRGPMWIPLTLPIIPGTTLVAPLFHPEEVSYPLAVLSANTLVYSIAAYAALARSKANVFTLRRATMRFAAPAAILFGLACVPALNPLWPQGMTELAKQETELQAAFPLGIELSRTRAILQAKGIEFLEQTETSDRVVLKGIDRSIKAAAGDQVVSARFQTNAYSFPCGYDMEIVLVFGRDDKLKQQYIHRFPMCP